MVLLKLACTWAMPWEMFLLPLALTILRGSMASSREMLIGAAGAAASFFSSFLLFFAALGLASLAGAASAATAGAAGADSAGAGSAGAAGVGSAGAGFATAPVTSASFFLGAALGFFSAAGLVSATGSAAGVSGAEASGLGLISSAIGQVILCRLWRWGCAGHRRSCAVPCGCGRWWRCAGPGRAIRAGGGFRGSN